MVSGVFSVARELPRLREISSVLIRYGLGDIVRRAGVSTMLERTSQSPVGAHRSAANDNVSCRIGGRSGRGCHSRFQSSTSRKLLLIIASAVPALAIGA